VILHEVVIEDTCSFWVLGVVVDIWIVFKLDVITRTSMRIICVHAKSGIKS
jgi:hypothetical protein